MNQETGVTTKTYKVIDLLWILFDHRKTLALSFLIAFVIGLILAFAIGRQYKSVARVLPPKETNLLSGLTGVNSLIRSLPSGLGALGKNNEQYEYNAILRSRTVSDEIVQKFDLLQVYKISDHSMEKAIKELEANTEFEWTEDNTLEIRVWDHNAERASTMANEYVNLLNKRSYQIQTQQARDYRMFIEQRLNQNKQDLYAAEEALRAYQKKQGMVIVMDPSSPAIASVADIYAQKVKKEIELGLLRQTISTSTQQYLQAEMELKAMNHEIAKFPDLGVESLRLFREVAIQQKILEFMVPLYEEAKVNEHKDVPVAYVLDTAIPGERPDRPKRIFVLGIATFLGLVIGFVILGVREYSASLKIESPEQYARLQSMKQRLFIRK
jgi:tyrosine-protein kinase Etk/Wzc